MADDHVKPEGTEETKAAPEAGVDLESVKIEDMELGEQQLRTVSGGKGYGRVGTLISFRREALNLQSQDLEQINPTIAQ